MLLRLTRFRSNHEATIGQLHLVPQYRTPKFLCHTLEDEYRDIKVKHHTRIPAGQYNLRLRTFGGFHARYSVLFADIHQGMIEIMNVPNFTDILLHVGNTDEDTSGCPLTGIWRGDDNFVGTSRKTYERVYAELAPLVASGALQQIQMIDGDR